MQTEYTKPRPGSYNDHMQYPWAMQRTLAPSHATKTTGAHATRCSRCGEPPSHMQPHQVVHTQCDAATITIYNNDTHSLWTTQQTLNPSHATDPMEPQRRVAHTLHSTATTRKTALLQITDNARKFSAARSGTDAQCAVNTRRYGDDNQQAHATRQCAANGSAYLFISLTQHITDMHSHDDDNAISHHIHGSTLHGIPVPIKVGIDPSRVRVWVTSVIPGSIPVPKFPNIASYLADEVSIHHNH
ncbi:hypothetical protein BU15DRAFT_62019 [Melanogaster broomeanus]|nr:hypothetical protein BU15DRAFT_62019 [Melanogaster broomeanus]